MIEHIGIDGYKCLKNVELTTTNLNVLVGANASGKSSVLQSILLLRQSVNKDGQIDALHLSGPLYEAGTVQDVLHPAAEHQIKLTLHVNGSVLELSFYHNRDSEIRESKRLMPARNKLQLPEVFFGGENFFSYLNAERVGPRVTYSLPSDEHNLAGIVGKHGEFTTSLLARASDGIVIDDWDEKLALDLAAAPEKLDGYLIKDEIIKTQGRLDLVCNIFLSWIIPGAEFDAKEHDSSDSASLRFYRDTLTTKTAVRATHIGFGLSYTLPVIAAALALKPGGLLLVENPEAHLHPFSQSRIGVFLALVAATGRQIFIETHSDHVLNGIRLAVAHGLIPAEKTRINFFNSINHNELSTANIIQISPNSKGQLDKWPAGFFDQIESDLSKL